MTKADGIKSSWPPTPAIDELSRVPNWLASERPFALPYDAGAVYVASI